MVDSARDRWQRFKLLAQRFLLLLIIYMALLHFTVLTAFEVVEYVRVSRELAAKNTEYSRLFREYSEELWESERLTSDKSYRRQVLKGTRYYSESDEELVLILEQ